MESVSNIDQIENLKQNNFIGKPEFVNSNITFRGKKRKASADCNILCSIRTTGRIQKSKRYFTWNIYADGERTASAGCIFPFKTIHY